MPVVAARHALAWHGRHWAKCLLEISKSRLGRPTWRQAILLTAGHLLAGDLQSSQQLSQCKQPNIPTYLPTYIYVYISRLPFTWWGIMTHTRTQNGRQTGYTTNSRWDRVAKPNSKNSMSYSSWIVRNPSHVSHSRTNNQTIFLQTYVRTHQACRCGRTDLTLRNAHIKRLNVKRVCVLVVRSSFAVSQQVNPTTNNKSSAYLGSETTINQTKQIQAILETDGRTDGQTAKLI